MKTTSRTLGVLLAAAALLMAGAAFAAQPLKIGIASEPYPPFTYKNSSGDWSGFEVDLAKALCKELDRTCVTVPTAWSGIIPALTSGKIDMIINSMSITKKRKKVVSFSKPYYKTQWAFVGRKDLHIEIPEGLKGKVLGVQRGDIEARYARMHLASTGVKLRFYPKQVQANKDLLAHRIDLILADGVAMHTFVKQPEAEAAGIEIKKTMPAKADGIAVALRKSSDKLRSQVSDAIEDMLADGTCKSLSEKYFGYNICIQQ